MADESFTIDIMNMSKLKVPELKRELKARGLSTMGNKNELIERLTETIKSGKNDDGSADSVDELIDEDDVLNDDEIEQEVDELKNIELEVSDKSFEADTNSNSTKLIKRKHFEISTDSSTKDGKAAKKIVLNRKSSTEVHAEEKDMGTTSSTNGSAEDKKVIKLSELSAKERLEMRAKKFGVPLSTDAKKEVRAYRFSQNSTTSTTEKARITLGNTPITATTATPNLDLLKKRAERFGTVSTQLLKVETAEKLEKRKARFGGEPKPTNGSTITTTITTATATTTDPQKAKRLERFKITLK